MISPLPFFFFYSDLSLLPFSVCKGWGMFVFYPKKSVMFHGILLSNFNDGLMIIIRVLQVHYIILFNHSSWRTFVLEKDLINGLSSTICLIIPMKLCMAFGPLALGRYHLDHFLKVLLWRVLLVDIHLILARLLFVDHTIYCRKYIFSYILYDISFIRS